MVSACRLRRPASMPPRLKPRLTSQLAPPTRFHAAAAEAAAHESAFARRTYPVARGQGPAIVTTPRLDHTHEDQSVFDLLGGRAGARGGTVPEVRGRARLGDRGVGAGEQAPPAHQEQLADQVLEVLELGRVAKLRQ